MPTRKGSDSERFWAKVAVTANPDKCWDWLAGTGKDGYGVFVYTATKADGKSVKAHRFAWFLLTGSWPSLYLLHSCDNPRCVNIRHLREGTTQDNADDMVARGRQARGERQHSAKFTSSEVRMIRQLVQDGQMTRAALARRFNVNFSSINKIVKRRTWKHVE